MNDYYYNVDDPATEAYVNGGLDGHDTTNGASANPMIDTGNMPDTVAADLTSGIDDTGTGTRRSLPNPGTDYTQQQMMDSANAVNASAGQPYPGDIAAMQGNVTAGDFKGPIARLDGTGGPLGGPSTINRLDATGPSALTQTDLYPSLPNPGGTGTSGGTTPSAGGTGQLSDAEWQKDFQQANGFYDPTFNSRAAFLHEAQMGDENIRGVGGGGDQLAKMAQYDSDAKQLYDAINGVGSQNFYNSEQSAQHQLLHNQQVTNEYQAALGQGGGGQQIPSGQGMNRGLGIVDHVNQAVATGNKAQLDWLKSQLVDVPASPIRNQDAFPVATELVKDLQTLGVDPKTIHMDDAGTIHFTSASGQPNYFNGNAPLADWVGDLATLKDAIAKQQQAATQPPAGGGGGGYPPRSNYPPRGGGGGGGGGSTPDPYAYQGQVAPYDQNTQQFQSVVNGKPIPAAPVPVDLTTGAIQPYNQQRNY